MPVLTPEPIGQSVVSPKVQGSAVTRSTQLLKADFLLFGNSQLPPPRSWQENSGTVSLRRLLELRGCRTEAPAQPIIPRALSVLLVDRLWEQPMPSCQLP
jgi:hypothetical protein